MKNRAAVDVVNFHAVEYAYQSLLKRLLADRPCHKAINHLPVSIPVALRPRWPIQTILLITRVEETDEATVDWLATFPVRRFDPPDSHSDMPTGSGRLIKTLERLTKSHWRKLSRAQDTSLDR